MMNGAMDDIRKIADSMDDDKHMSVKEVKALIHSICGYAECLMELRHLIESVNDVKIMPNCSKSGSSPPSGYND